MNEYRLTDDPIPEELLQQALALSSAESFHKIYFDRDTSEIYAISNEIIDGYEHFFEVPTEQISHILNNERLEKYKVKFDADDVPSVILKPVEDSTAPTLIKLKSVDNWDSELTVEQYPLLKKWGFHLRADKRQRLKFAGINSRLEFFIVDANNKNFVINTVSFNFQELCENERVFIPFSYAKETDLNIEIYTKTFFKTIGFKVLYDTED